MFTEHRCITCNRHVEPIEHISPVYDDGGSIDSMDIEVEYPEECPSCLRERYEDAIADSHINMMKDQEDDLPF